MARSAMVDWFDVLWFARWWVFSVGCWVWYFVSTTPS